MIAKSTAVLGGGITGLMAAYRLATLGHRVRLFEMSARVGGAIRTETTGGWLIEAGPNSLLADSPIVISLLRELGLDSETVAAGPAAQNRYLAHGGSPVPIPLTPAALVRSPLFSARAKLRVAAERLARPRERVEDVTVADFIRDHFGPEVLERAMQPFVSGIWAGDPAKLSARAAFPKLWEMERRHGSLIGGQIAAAKSRLARGEPAIPQVISFRRGLQTLPWALTSRLPEGTLTLNAAIASLEPGGGRWRVGWRDGEAIRRESFDVVVAALPAAPLARMEIGPAGERPLSSLAGIEHPPVASLFLGFRREQVAHPLDGFGILIPRTERRSALGILFSSSLFPGRAPAGGVALTVMAGGALQPEIARLSPGELLEAVRPDLRDLLGVAGEPVLMRHAFWPEAIPQYNLGHEKHLAAIAATEQANPGIFIGGQVRDGISLSQCIAAGEALAERASQ